MISIDATILAAILIFLGVVFVLNYALLHPLGRVLEERAARTTGLAESAKRDVDHSLDLFSRYQAAIKQARMDGYRALEQARAEAQKCRADTLEQARREAGRQVQTSQEALAAQVEESKSRLARDVDEIARGIAASILGRSA